MRRGWVIVGALFPSMAMVTCSSFSAAPTTPEGDAGVDAVPPGDAAPVPDATDDAHDCVRISPNVCVDRTEVTNDQYRSFYQSAKTRTVPTPPCDATGVPAAGTSLTGPPSDPVANVTWCDAYAFCKWAGKHLCGGIGGAKLPLASLPDPASNEWLQACNATTADATGCNIAAGGNIRPVATGTCGVDGVSDMIGNVWEWVDSCDDQGACEFMGSAYNHPGKGCNAQASVARGVSEPDIGFRCCGTP